jgi:glutaredoxin
MKVTKFTSEYCGRCKKLDSVWGDIKSLHPEWEYEEVNIIKNPDAVKELVNAGLTILPIIKLDDGKEQTYASITSLSEYKAQIGYKS